MQLRSLVTNPGVSPIVTGITPQLLQANTPALDCNTAPFDLVAVQSFGFVEGREGISEQYDNE